MFFGWNWTPTLPPGSFDPAEKLAIKAENESKLARTPWAVNIFRYKTSPVGEFMYYCKTTLVAFSFETLSSPLGKVMCPC